MNTMETSSSGSTWKLLSAALLALNLGFGLAGCRGGVRHPDSGEENTKKYCADRRESENNCMACSSQPGCGFCEKPRNGEAHCQPGADASIPGTCSEGWSFSTEDCETPPPPPPPAPPPPLEGEGADGEEMESDPSSEE